MRKRKNGLVLFVFGVVAVLLAFSLGVFAQQLTAEIVKYKIVVDGEEKIIDNDIVTINDRTYVPIRALSEVLGKQVDWDEEHETISISEPVSVVPHTLTEEEKAAEAWYLFCLDGLWGMMDADGAVKIEPVYQSIFEFSEGLAAVENDEGKIGYITPDGEVAIPFEFYRPEVGLEVYGNVSFSEGLAMVLNEEGKCGYINRYGDVVIPFIYYEAEPFKNGAAKVGVREVSQSEEDISNGRYVYNYIDHTGKILFKSDFLSTMEYIPGIVCGAVYDSSADAGYRRVCIDVLGNEWDYEESSLFGLEADRKQAVNEPQVMYVEEAGKIKVYDENEHYIETVDGYLAYDMYTYALIYTDEQEKNTFVINNKGEIIRPKI